MGGGLPGAGVGAAPAGHVDRAVHAQQGAEVAQEAQPLLGAHRLVLLRDLDRQRPPLEPGTGQHVERGTGPLRHGSLAGNEAAGGGGRFGLLHVV